MKPIFRSYWTLAGALALIIAVWSAARVLNLNPKSLVAHEGDGTS